MKQARNYCFTDFELLRWEHIFETHKDKIRYVCWGTEKCPSTHKVHYQGWIQFHTKRTLGGVKKIVNSKKIHLESCRGSEFDNEKYCKKDGNYKSLGKFIKQGQRTDLEKIYQDIKEGKKLEDIWNDEDGFKTYCQYRNGIKDAKEHFDKVNRKEFRKVKVNYCFGPTGTGKTRYAMKHKDVFKIHGSELNWFDGYDGEKTLVIDEYANDIKITKLLGLLDGYQLRLPIKGGFTYANWNKVIITSNLNPKELHNLANDIHRTALFRRITKIKKFKKLP